MRASKFRIQNSEFRTLNSCRRRGFTLTEVLISITIIALLAGLGLSAYSGAIEMAREQRTRAQIAKIDQFIMERYEGYRTRAVPIKIPAGVASLQGGGRLTAMMRLNALRDLMRMELPERKSDVIDPPCDYFPGPGTRLYMASPSLRNTYLRMAARNVGAANFPAGWSESQQGAECLYLILSTMRDGDKTALDFFSSDEIGDIDGDNMKEILDGWGNPIEFIRWPAGYTELQPGNDGKWGVANVDDDGINGTDDLGEAGWPGSDDIAVRTTQTRNYLKAPDPFDPVKVHGGSAPPGPLTLFGTSYTPGYLLQPLIISAGRDKQFDIITDINLLGSFMHYSPVPTSGFADDNYPNPYVVGSAGLPVGTVGDVNGDGYLNYPDNITNHDKTQQ